MVVSGNVELRDWLDLRLSQHHLDVIVATTFADAFTAAACTWIDGAVVDSDLGSEKGLDLCRELLRQSASFGRAIPLWFVMKTMTPDLPALALEEAGVTLLRRGFDLEQLVGQIDVRLLEARQPGRINGKNHAGPSQPPQFSSGIRALTYSIKNRLLVTFRYTEAGGKSAWRKAEPHVLGTDKEGNSWLLAYHPGPPGSTSGMPGWRTYRVDAMVDVLVTIEPFHAETGQPRGMENLARIILRA